jgi:hypothetical protein
MSELKSATANLASEAAVGTSCGTTLGKHRFVIKLNGSEYFKYLGLKTWVLGFSSTGGSNYFLRNSGKFTVPTIAVL